MNKPNTIESVRRVDNFPKDVKNDICVDSLVTFILAAIDKEVEYNVEKAKKLTVLDDEIELAECYASARVLEELQDLLLTKIDKGE